MQAWSSRAVEEANLFNPAFCVTLLARAIDDFSKKTKTPMPFSLAFLVLPIVLHRGTRTSLPASTVTSVLAWVQDNREQLVGFATRVQRLTGITREAVLFGIHHETLVATANGALATGPRRQTATERRTGLFTDEARECAVLRRTPERVYVNSFDDGELDPLLFLANRSGTAVQVVGESLHPYKAITVIAKVN